MLKWLWLFAVLAPPALAQSQFDSSSFRIAGKGGKDKPFVIVIPGSSGNIPGQWMSAATSAGFGAVGIELGRIYGRPLYGVSEHTMAAAVAKAVEVGRQAGFDVNRYALIGTSKGGTVAMVASTAISSAGFPAPKAIFAFYPGSMGSCPLSASGGTRVHIFYGDADEWGNFRGTRSACSAQAGGNVSYHEFPGAHHGFDSSGSGQFSCCGGQFRYQPNPQAASRSSAIVRRALSAIK